MVRTFGINRIMPVAFSEKCHFFLCFRYRWVHPSGALIGSYKIPAGG